MNNLILCGASRGRYSKPIPYTKKHLNWMDEDTYKPIKQPQRICCEDSRHFDNLLIAKRNGEVARGMVCLGQRI